MLIKVRKPKAVIRVEWLLDISMILYITSSTWISALDFLPISSVWIMSAIIYGLLISYCILKKELPSWQAVTIILISVILFSYAYFSHPENRFYFTRETYGLSRVFRPDRAIYFVIFISLYRKKPQKLLNTLWISSILLCFFGGIEFLQAITRGYWLEYDYSGQITHFSYSLSFGYRMILPCLIFIYNYIKNRNTLSLILSIVVFGMIFIGGSRGQLVCIAAFICLILFRFYSQSNNIHKCVIILCLFIFFIIISFIGVQNILNIIGNILESMGISSRTLDSLLTRNFTDDNSRFLIWGRAINAIKNGGFFGYGVYGDRPIISSMHYAGYCHNIFLELMVNFGAVIGLLLSGIIVCRSIYIITIKEDNIWIDLFTIMFAISVQLLISMSFWYVMGFWGAVECSHYCKKEKD
nr:O-antigen ligase family protein [uncultured Anaerostipes sp.]